jgi:hypothetical protein
MKRPQNQEPCPVEDCGSNQDYNGMCAMHATRVTRHGNPAAFTHQRDRSLPRGPEHFNWSGSRITYHGAHIRVRRARGKASAYRCVGCGGAAAQWSYDHQDPAELNSKDGPYSAEPEHYVPRCVPCHKRHDLALLPLDDPTRAFHDAVRRLHGEGVRATPMARLLGVSRGRIDRALDVLELPHFRPGNTGNRPLRTNLEGLTGGAA